jgi:serine-type D-Ala-D-Ala carboxypeptidase (penicillin-binding protein 5/6)
MDACERDRQDRVPERAHADRARLHLPLAARNHQAAGRASKGDDALALRALLPPPDEEARGAHLEAAERAQLYLQLAFPASHARRALPPLDATHPAIDSIRWPFVRRLALVLLLAATALTWPTSGSAAAPPTVKAKAVVVADASGTALHELHADQRLAMASITKIMTALLTLERTRPAQRVRVMGPASSIGESTFNLRPGERLRVRELLTAALVQSANDAAYALATYVGHGRVKAFVRLMNQRAAQLGLTGTHYARPDGLDARRHYSTALDTLRLAREAMKNRLFRKIVRMRGGVVAGRRLYVWNDLLRTYPGAIGVKTGHTDRAGWSEVAAAKRDGVTLYAVLLGSPSRSRRNRDLAALLDWGFDQYGRVRVISPGRTYATAAIPFSDARVALVPSRGSSKVVKLAQPLVEQVLAPEEVDLPLVQGERVGEILIYDGERVVARRPLVAATGVEEASLPRRVRWYAGQALDEAGDMLSSLSPF